jgi:superfamily II RNA helicase
MPRKPPKHFQWIERELKHIHRKIHVDEVVNEIEPHVPPPHPQMGFAVDAWVKGLDFDEIVDISRLDEGALVRYLRMINQLLRQIVQAPYTSDSLRAIARDARKLINRDVVDAERQLRVEIDV